MSKLDIKELNNDLTQYRINCAGSQLAMKNKLKFINHKIDRTTISLNDLEELKENLIFIEELYNHLTKNISS